MGFDVGSVVAYIKADISQFKDGLNSAKEEASSFGDKIGGVSSILTKFTLVAAAAAAGAAVIFTKQSIDAAKDAQVEVMKFNTMMRNSVGTTDKIKNSILEYSKSVTKLGFDDEEAALSTARFFQRTGDLTESIMLNNISMDLARDKNMTLTESQKMVGLVLSGNGRALKQYGIDLKESATPMEAIIELQGKLKGSAQNYSQTYAGSLAVFNAQFTNFKEVVGTQLLPVLTVFITKITEIVTAMMAWEEKNQIITQAINGIKTVIGIATEFYKKHTDIINAVALGLGSVVAILVILNIVMGIATLAATAFGIIMAFITSPIGLVILIIGALIAIGYLLIKNWDEVLKFGQWMLDQLVAAWNTLVDNLKFIGGLILDAITKPFKDAWGFISGIVNKIKDAIKSVMNWNEKHSPSYIDLLNKSVKDANRAMSNLDFGGLINLNPSASFVGQGNKTQVANVTVSLAGAFIGDMSAASRISEQIGDGIIKKLQKNIRF